MLPTIPNLVGWLRAKSFARKTFGAKRVFVAHHSLPILLELACSNNYFFGISLTQFTKCSHQPGHFSGTLFILY